MNKNHFLGVLVAFSLTGCNITDFKLPTIGANDSSTSVTQESESASLKKDNNIVQNALIEEICEEATKNEARANSKYAHKAVVSAQGKFDLRDELSGGYNPEIIFRTQNFNVSLDLNRKTQNWENYDNGQIVSSGNVKVGGVAIHDPIGGSYGNGKYNCYIMRED